MNHHHIQIKQNRGTVQNQYHFAMVVFKFRGYRSVKVKIIFTDSLFILFNIRQRVEINTQYVYAKMSILDTALFFPIVLRQFLFFDNLLH